MQCRGRGFRGNGTPHEGHHPCQSRLAVVSLYGCEYHVYKYMRIVPAQYTSPGVNIVRTSLWGGGEGGKVGDRSDVKTLVISSISTLSGVSGFQGNI